MSEDYHALAERLRCAVPFLSVAGLYLPSPVPDEAFRDEFGFVFLSDGSVGPFYVSMDDILRELWLRYPDPSDAKVQLDEVFAEFVGTSLAARALALGAFNALSQALFRSAGYMPLDRALASGSAEMRSGARVGMVGYFCPLVDKLLAAGANVVVLEKVPQRVRDRVGLEVTSRVGDLANCQRILCTASVLINDTLAEVVAACSGATRIELVGPSGSGLPDVAFAYGVTAVGGIAFADQPALLGALSRGESWGSVGRKYQINRGEYHGVDVLLRQLSN